MKCLHAEMLASGFLFCFFPNLGYQKRQYFLHLHLTYHLPFLLILFSPERGLKTRLPVGNVHQTGIKKWLDLGKTLFLQFSMFIFVVRAMSCEHLYNMCSRNPHFVRVELLSLRRGIRILTSLVLPSAVVVVRCEI